MIPPLPVGLRIMDWISMKNVLDYCLLSFVAVGSNKLKLLEILYFKSLKAACSLPNQVNHDKLL